MNGDLKEKPRVYFNGFNIYEELVKFVSSMALQAERN